MTHSTKAKPACIDTTYQLFKQKNCVSNISDLSDKRFLAMAWKPIHFGLAGMMLLFGSFNTLSVKWADTMTSESVDGTKRPFNHPFLQATGMFLGEMMCMLAFWIVRYRTSRQQQTSSYPPLAEENTPRKFNPLVSLFFSLSPNNISLVTCRCSFPLPCVT